MTRAIVIAFAVGVVMALVLALLITANLASFINIAA